MRKYCSISRVLKSIYLTRDICPKGHKSNCILRRDHKKRNTNIVIFTFRRLPTFLATTAIHPGRVAKSISRGLRITRTEDEEYIFASSARMPAAAVITNHFHGTLPRQRNGVEGTSKGQRATIEAEINRRWPWPATRDFANFAIGL